MPPSPPQNHLRLGGELTGVCRGHQRRQDSPAGALAAPSGGPCHFVAPAGYLPPLPSAPHTNAAPPAHHPPARPSHVTLTSFPAIHPHTHSPAQIWLVQSFCNRGSLYDGIDRGFLRTPEGRPNLVAILATGGWGPVHGLPCTWRPVASVPGCRAPASWDQSVPGSVRGLESKGEGRSSEGAPLFPW